MSFRDGGNPALDHDLNLAVVVKESIGVMRCHRLIRFEIGPIVPRTFGDLLESLNQETKTRPIRSDSKTKLSAEGRKSGLGGTRPA